MSDPVKRLYRSRRHRVIAGVCGGVAEYFALDPVIVRILWILFTIAGGAGLLTYIAALFIMENNPHEEPPKEEAPPHPSSQRAFWGTVLIVVGLVLCSPRSDGFISPSSTSDGKLSWQHF